MFLATDSFVYPYLVGQATDPTGGGIIIPLPEPEGIEAEYVLYRSRAC